MDDASENAATSSILVALAAKYPNRVRVLKLAHNRGDGIARKAGIVESRGDIIGFCDADLQGVTGEGLKRLFDVVLRDEADHAISLLEYDDGTEPRLNCHLAQPLLRVFVPALAAIIQSPLAGIRISKRDYLFPDRIDPRCCMMGITLDAWHAGARMRQVTIGPIQNRKQDPQLKAERADLVLKTALRRFAAWGLRPQV